MKSKQIRHLLPDEAIINKIFLVRGQKVMFDKDLALLYGVLTKNLNKAVSRNPKRFPVDFMFRLTKVEYNSLRFQIGTLEKGAHSKYLPFVFTEQGVAMLSIVLNSERAIEVNIRIIRIFTKMREMMMTHKNILLKLEQIEKKLMKQHTKTTKHDDEIQLIFTYLKRLLNPASAPMKKIGYKRYND